MINLLKFLKHLFYIVFPFKEDDAKIRAWNQFATTDDRLGIAHRFGKTRVVQVHPVAFRRMISQLPKLTLPETLSTTNDSWVSNPKSLPTVHHGVDSGRSYNAIDQSVTQTNAPADVPDVEPRSYVDELEDLDKDEVIFNDEPEASEDDGGDTKLPVLSPAVQVPDEEKVEETAPHFGDFTDAPGLMVAHRPTYHFNISSEVSVSEDFILEALVDSPFDKELKKGRSIPIHRRNSRTKVITEGTPEDLYALRKNLLVFSVNSWTFNVSQESLSLRATVNEKYELPANVVIYLIPRLDDNGKLVTFDLKEDK